MSYFTDASAEELGPDGPGYYLAQNVLPELMMGEVCEELGEPAVPWWPQYNSFVNARNIEVKQAFDVFAHKFSRGSQESLRRMPALYALSRFIVGNQIEPLTSAFPSLKRWETDELSVQRYPAETGGLSFHKDLERHPGLIAIASLSGKAALHVKRANTVQQVTCRAGDVLLLRAPGLYPTKDDIRPEHAVASVISSESRISMTLRANTRPDELIPNFSYDNWP